MSISPSEEFDFPAAGDLRQRIDLLKSVRVSDQAGGSMTVWQKVATVWAYLRPFNARELNNAQQIDSRLTYIVTINYRKDVVPQMRIQYKNKDLLIHGVINQGEFNRALILHCEDLSVRTGA